MSRVNFTHKEALYPSLCSPSFSQTLSSLPLPPFFLSPTFTHSILPRPLSSHLPSLNPSPLSSSPSLPFFPPSFLCSYHALLPPSPSPSTSPIFPSDHLTICRWTHSTWSELSWWECAYLLMAVCECWFVIRWITNHIFYINCTLVLCTVMCSLTPRLLPQLLLCTMYKWVVYVIKAVKTLVTKRTFGMRVVISLGPRPPPFYLRFVFTIIMEGKTGRPGTEAR